VDRNPEADDWRLTLKLGLKGKLAVVFGAIILVAFSLVYIATSSLSTSILMEQEVRSLTGTSEILVPVLLSMAHDGDELEQALYTASQHSGLDTVQILNTSMETIAPRRCTPAEILVGQETLRAVLERPEGAALVRSPVLGKAFVSVRPLPGGGFLFAARDAGPFLKRKTSIVTLLIIWGAVVMLAILLGGSIVLRHLVARPIERLVSEAGAIATGDKELAAAALDTDEFGFLRSSLHSMAGKIREERRRIEEHVRELTEVNEQLSEAREQLIRTEKLASVGQLAAGVAHEIGNPIGVILGYIEMLEDESLDPEIRTDAVGQIKRATERIRTTIGDLLDFSRPAADEDAASDVVIETREIVQFVSPQPRFRNVAVELDNRLNGSPRCAIPPSRYKQVMLNLLFNAADAMKGSGNVTVTVWQDNETVRVSIADTGPGIDDSVLLRVFDPFFSTKGIGKGTGLGLFVCHSIMSRYGGEIEVATALEGGAVMTLTLPVEQTAGG